MNILLSRHSWIFLTREPSQVWNWYILSIYLKICSCPTSLSRPIVLTGSRCTRAHSYYLPKFVNTDGKSMESIQKEIDRSVSTLSSNIYTPEGKAINVIRIPGDKKARIKKELANIGISEGFVYSDIEHRSNTLLNLPRSYQTRSSGQENPTLLPRSTQVPG